MAIKYNFYVQLDKANERLRIHSARLFVRGERLWIQATLPPKPGSTKERPHQQSVSTGQRATVAGLAAAEKIAQRLRRELDSGAFCWEDWSRGRKAKPKKPAETCKEWVDLFRDHWEGQRKRSHRAWGADWWPYFKELPMETPLTELALEQAVMAKEQDSCARKKAVERLTTLSRFAGIDCDLAPYRGNYSLQEVNPRSLPPDEWIADTYAGIEDPLWQRLFGLMACYGLRNSELASLEFLDYPIVTVLVAKNGKPRGVAPSNKTWAAEWDLRGEVPTSTNRQQLGQRIGKWFKKHDFQKPNGDRLLPYDLRHCTARRWAERGANADLAAQMMGHAPSVHHKIYRRFIGEKVWLDRAMNLD